MLPASLPSLLLALGQSPGDDGAALRALAARCGEELDWAASWDEAAARARAEHKPVLAVAWLYPGFDLTDGPRTIFAADPDVIELVNERCVPFVLRKDTSVPFAAPELYGLSPTVFGSGLLLCAPDGRVLADLPTLAPAAACDFLRAELARQPDLAGAPVLAGLGAEERAARHIARGELDLAERLLAEPGSARGHLLRAKLLRLRRAVEPALAALRAARERAPAALAAELDLEELLLRWDAGQASELRAHCERLLARENAAAGETALAAAYLLGYLELNERGYAAAAARWGALVREHPASPWAARAAAALLFPRGPLESGVRLGPPAEDALASLRDEPWAPLPASETAAAEAGAVRWLLAAQRADGTWPSPTEIEESAARPDEISAAIDALCARSLLARARLPGCRAAAERTLRGFLAGGERSRTPLAMDYSPWRRWAWLELVLDALEAGLADADELRGAALRLADGLVGAQRPNGGWSYFLSTSLEKDAPRLEQSISFMTAPIVLALLRARELGVQVDGDALERALDCLAAMRGPDGTFAYMLWPGQQENLGEARAGGAAGRSPVCELALLRGGRSDRERLEAALELFLRHAASLDRERGKALMHAGPEGQGCHYVLFDYATAARAAAELPADERVRARLLELLLATRRADGAFLDTPILGPACGTALALAALADLGLE